MWYTTKSLDNQGSCARVVFLFKDQCTVYLLSHELYFSTQSLFDFEKTKERQPKPQKKNILHDLFFDNSGQGKTKISILCDKRD